MSCDIVSDLTISAIVCAMLEQNMGRQVCTMMMELSIALRHAVRKLGKCYLMQILHP